MRSLILFKKITMFNKFMIKIFKVFCSNRLKILYTHLARGVSFKDFKSTFIDHTVIISQEGVFIEDNVTIKGTCSIAKNVKILKGSYIIDSEIKEGSTIGPFVYIKEAIIGENNQVGPFTYIRPGTISASKVKIGAFVETKKVLIDENSKVPHLSYIGDASIGKNVNIGAGVITCNYNGEKKSKTIIGDNVFVGSDVQFIAPVSVANNAYIAAGSTINKDVSEFDLAISRSKQENKANYVKKIRGKKCVE